MIKGLSERRRLPRAGKIRLGVMIQEAGKKPYPKATNYFVCPPEVTEALGLPAEPRELPIMFPSDDPERLFPQELRMYRSAGLWCLGDNQVARRWGDDGQLHEMKCPCPYLDSEECGPEATLYFLLPDVPGIGVWVLRTKNKASITSLNTSFEQFTGTFGGLRGIPFLLKLEPSQTQRWDDKQRKMVKTTLHVLRLDSPYTLRQIHEWRRALGKPVEALMPAREPEEETPVETVPANGGPAPTAESPPPVDNRQRAVDQPAPVADEETDVSVLFFWAARAGVKSEDYTDYLAGVYGIDVDNLPLPRAITEQREFLAGDPQTVRRTVEAVAGKVRARRDAKQGRLV